MSIKQAKSKAFKKGRKVGYWLAMQNIKKNKPKLEVEEQKGVSKKSKPKSKPKLEVEEQKGVSKKSKPKSTPKLEVEEQKGVSKKSKPKSKPKLEVEEQKGVSVKTKKPKKILEVEDQQGVTKEGMSQLVKDFLKQEVPTKKILQTEDLPSINIEANSLETHDIGIQNDIKNEIKLAIEESLKYDIQPYDPNDNYEPINNDEINYAWDLLKDATDHMDILNEKDKKLIKKKKGLWWKNDDDLDNELQRMIEQVKPEDPLPTPSEEAELFAMADDY